MTTVSPLRFSIDSAIRSFLLGILPAGTDVFRGQINRVPEPKGSNFVVFWPLRRPRLATNVDDVQDETFVGSISNTTLTITDVTGESATLDAGRAIYGPSIAPGTGITARGTGTGGVGTYTVTPTQTAVSQNIAAGTASFEQSIEYVVQLDVHGTTSDDNAQIISTLFRDAYAVGQFPEGMSPLYCEDPRQVPFTNAEQQIETRWIVEIHLQVDETVVGLPQQFADALTVDVINVDAAYPS